ncbi:MAG TPA: exosortase/archaeosortase family protein [Verrucomicrobiae bacterium]
MPRSLRLSTSGVGLALLWLAPLGWLWFVLINDLRGEWSVNPQYAYGWAVPFLCGYLFWQRLHLTEPKGDGLIAKRFSPAVAMLLLAACALLYAPTRLVQEANPGWRLTSWALALETVGVTLCLARLAAGNWRTMVFPICYFLVAVPWPTPVEIPLIQWLTRLDAAVTCEVLGWLGIPAMPHGNVIEVATGTVGIDEACSGIRSFQATLMISLFLGDYYHLRVPQRMALCLSGFALSLAFNLTRMGLLVWVAARQGVDAIARWHDPAGVTILLACFFGLWGVSIWMKHRLRAPNKIAGNPLFARPVAPVAPWLGVALCVWIGLTEISVESWYRTHESRVAPAVRWTIAFPTNNATLQDQPLSPRTLEILRYDEGRSGAWRESGLQWQAIFLHWNAGRTALHLAQNHTPEVCMTAAGHAVKVIEPQEWIEVGELRLPFAVYEIEEGSEPSFIYYCLWDDRASAQGFQTVILDYGHRLAPVWAGLRNPGQRSLELSLSGANTPAEAEAAVRKMLPKLIAIGH